MYIRMWECMYDVCYLGYAPPDKDQKKFRDWLNHPLLQDTKVGSSVIDALGHICYDITRQVRFM